MAKKIYWASLGTVVGVGLFVAFIYLQSIGAMTITGVSGDMTCAGTAEEPCEAYINFTAHEDIFLYKLGYDPWGRDIIFFDTPVKDWKIYRSWGTTWREIDLNKGCTGSWCGCSWCSANNPGQFSIAFRTGRDYQIKIVGYKYNLTQDIKWTFGYKEEEVDPVWNGYTEDDFFVELVSNKADIDGGEAVFKFKNPTTFNISINNDNMFDIVYDVFAGENVKATTIYILTNKSYSKNVTDYKLDCENFTDPDLGEVESCFEIPIGWHWNNYTDEEWEEIKSGDVLKSNKISKIKVVSFYGAYLGERSIDWKPQFIIQNQTIIQEKWAFFDSNWGRCQNATFYNLTDTIARVKEGVTDNATGLTCSAINCQDFRVVNTSCNNSGSSIPYTNISNTSVSMEYSTLVNTSAGANATYSIYYDYSGASAPSFTDGVIVTNGSTANITGLDVNYQIGLVLLGGAPNWFLIAGTEYMDGYDPGSWGLNDGDWVFYVGDVGAESDDLCTFDVDGPTYAKYNCTSAETFDSSKYMRIYEFYPDYIDLNEISSTDWADWNYWDASFAGTAYHTNGSANTSSTGTDPINIDLDEAYVFFNDSSNTMYEIWDNTTTNALKFNVDPGADRMRTGVGTQVPGDGELLSGNLQRRYYVTNAIGSYATAYEKLRAFNSPLSVEYGAEELESPDYSIDVYLNGTQNDNKTYVYPSGINATGVSATTGESINIYRNETLLKTGTTTVERLDTWHNISAVDYKYKVNSTNNDTGLTFYATVNQGGTDVTLYVNGSSTSQTFAVLDAINLTASSNVSDLFVNLSLNASGFGDNFYSVVSPAINISNFSTWDVIEDYNFTAIVNGTTNYSDSAAETLIITIKNYSITVVFADGVTSEFRINATSTNGTFEPVNQTSALGIYNISNIGNTTINVTLELNASLPTCMPTYRWSNDSTITDTDANVTNATARVLNHSVEAGTTFSVWANIDYISCTANATYDKDAYFTAVYVSG